MEKEIRNIVIEFRANEENRTIEGRAIPFNVFSPNHEGFREMISPEAVEGVIEKSDIKFLYNHDGSKGFLARNNKGKGTLKIDVREDGVYFSFKAKKDNLSNYVYDRLVSGELDEMSWAFTIAEDGDRWIKAEDGVYERTIVKFDRLYDFSAVDTSYYGIPNVVSARFAEIQEADRKALEEAQRLEEEKRQAEEEAKRQEEEREKEEQLASYYKELKEKYLN